MSDFPLPGLCVGPFFGNTGKVSSGYVDVVGPLPSDGLFRLVDQCLVTARRNTGDIWCNSVLYVDGSGVTPSHPLMAVGDCAGSAEELSGTNVVSWSNQVPFWLPSDGGVILILGVDNAGISGASWGSCTVSGRLFTALN